MVVLLAVLRMKVILFHTLYVGLLSYVLHPYLHSQPFFSSGPPPTPLDKHLFLTWSSLQAFILWLLASRYT